MQEHNCQTLLTTYRWLSAFVVVGAVSLLIHVHGAGQCLP